MSVKIRLSRHGKKKYAYYHIVVADSRAPRDGRFIERIGSYDPNANPAMVNLDFDKALAWLLKGAQPTDTTRSILSREGVMMKKHLIEGVNKGAFDMETAEKRFEAWKAEKILQIENRRQEMAEARENEVKKRLSSERKANEAKAQKIASKLAERAAKEKEASEAASEAPATEQENA